MIDIAPVIREYGWNIGLVALLVSTISAYVWRDWRRIEALELRVENLETEFRVEMSRAIASMEQALRDSTTQVVLSRKVVESFLLKNT